MKQQNRSQRRFGRAARWSATGAVIAGLVMSGGLVNSASASSRASTSTAKVSYPPVTLTLEDYFASTDPFTTWANEFSAKVLKDTKGAVNIKVYPNAELVSQTAATGAIQNDTVNMGVTSDATLNSFASGFAIPDLPFLVNTWKQQNAVVESPKVRAIQRQALTSSGLTEITDCPNGPVWFLTKTPVSSISGFSGMKVRAADALHGSVVTAFGGAPETIALGETYEALQLGTVTGVVTAPETFYTSDLYQVAKYIDEIPAGAGFLDLVMSTKAFGQLSNAEQKIVTSDGASMAASCSKLEQNAVTRSLRSMVAGGATLVKAPKNLTPFIKASAAVDEQNETATPLASQFTAAVKAIVDPKKK